MPVPIPTTLLELVSCVSAVTDSDREVVATVAYLVNSGKVTLRGSFTGHRIRIS